MHTTPFDASSPRRRYPSDLSDAQWGKVSDLMPRPRGIGRPRARELREIVNAIHYRWETGCAWRMLPHDFPPWGTVYAYFRQWQRTGVLRPLREALVRPLRPSGRVHAGQPTAAASNTGFANPALSPDESWRIPESGTVTNPA